MAETVDLMVVGVSDGTTRDELTQKLMKEFGQEAAAFLQLTDAAFGDAEPYAAQSGVLFTMAEEGKKQLEKFGVVCKIVSATASKVPPSVTPTVTETSFEDAAQDTVSDTDNKAADAVAEDVDFSAELGDIGLSASGVSEDSSSEISDLEEDVKPDASMQAEAEKASSKSDVPEALESASFEDLSADLIDPAPKEKEKKAPVVMDDGGLSLSDDDSKPLTTPKAKSDPNSADDGGLSLDSGDAEVAAKSPDVSAEKASNDQASVVSAETASVAFEELDAETVDVESNADVSFEELGESDAASEEASVSFEDDAVEATGVADDGATESVSFEEEASVEEEVSFEEKASVEEEVSFEEEASVEEEVSFEEIDATSSDATDTASASAEEVDAKSSDTADAVIESVEEVEAEASDSADAVSIASDKEQITEVTSDVVSASPDVREEDNSESEVKSEPEKNNAVAPSSGGLVLPGQAASVVPEVTPEDRLEKASAETKTVQSGTVTFVETRMSGEAAPQDEVVEQQVDAAANDEPKTVEQAVPKSAKVKKVAAALAGVAVLAGGATFALMNAGSIGSSQEGNELAVDQIAAVQDARVQVKQVKVVTGDLSNNVNLEELSTEQLLSNLSVSSNAQTITGLEPYFLDSVNRNRSGPRFGAAVPAESVSMVGVKDRVPHPADKYFDEWSNREADLFLFLALLDSLIEKGELDVARQLTDRAKDKLFSVMSSQRLARAYSDAGQNEEVSKLMALAARDTFAIKAPEERVLAISDYGLTEQALGLNEDAMDTFLKTSILARNLDRPERRTVGLSSAARYFQRSGRVNESRNMLEESLASGMKLPKNTAARDLSIRYVALTEARMGLFNQALENIKTIVDPFAAVSAYHGVALAIESTGDETSARRVLNMAYRAGSDIEDPNERSDLLSKVVLASESD